MSVSRDPVGGPSCLSEDEVHAFLSGHADAQSRVESHLGDCDRCRQLILFDASSKGDAFTLTHAETLVYLRKAGLEASHPSDVVGERLGRYVLLHLLGSGGIGQVYGGYDPALDRKVAIKILRPSQQLSNNLMAEGRALARIAHPNIVPVYDVGLGDGDRPFIAMEYVDGGTLADHVKKSSVNRPQIVELYRDAALGLAELHRAGFVHRDFKPSNVLVGRDGRARVADFGLATSHRSRYEQGLEDRGDGVQPKVESTRIGRIVGTPAYMAPECFSHGEASPASDVFSVCASLHDSLYGKRPYEGNTIAELALALESPPSILGDDDRLKGILRKGLATSVDARFTDAAELATALTEYLVRRSRRRRVVTVACGALVAAAMAVTGAWFFTGGRDVCATGDSLAARLWSSSRGEVIGKALSHVGSDGGENAGALLDRRLSTYAAAWAREYRSVCEATHLDGRQSSVLLDRRLYCLERAYGRAEAVTDMMAHAKDPTTVELAVVGTYELPRPSRCRETDPNALASRPGPQDREAVGRLDRELDALEASSPYAAPSDIDAHVGELAGRAEQLGFAGVVARALILQAVVRWRTQRDEPGTEALWRKAIGVLRASNDEELKTTAWVGLAQTLRSLARPSEWEIAIATAETMAGSLHKNSLLMQKVVMERVSLTDTPHKLAQAREVRDNFRRLDYLPGEIKILDTIVRELSARGQRRELARELDSTLRRVRRRLPIGSSFELRLLRHKARLRSLGGG